MANGSDNNSLLSCKDYDGIHRLHLVWHSLVFVLGLSLNGFALWVFLRVLRLHTVVIIYMSNLATCDLLFTLALPLRIYYTATDAWLLGDVPCQVAGSIFQINLYGSCLFLACINVDRFLALVYPLRSRHLRRPKVAWRACAAVWAVIVLGSVPVALVHDTSRCLDANSTVQVRCFESFSPATWRREILPLLALAEILGFLLPLFTVLYCSARILHTLNPGASPHFRRRRKTVNLLLVNAVIFVVCFVPYNVVLAAYGLMKAKSDQSATNGSKVLLRLVLQLTMLLASANCCLDPLVYYFSTEGFRRTLSRRGTEATALTAGTGRHGGGGNQATQRLALLSCSERAGPVAGQPAPGGEMNGRGESVI
ncbi:lysophosphatidic acid receptor 5-like [Heterodontus francisci]|uniref:lysophosphatidic acid receptor 5-like n=1 Tax=Heterodontus francisci TaxID=7792 RepID=UPI00355B2B78